MLKGTKHYIKVRKFDPELTQISVSLPAKLKDLCLIIFSFLLVPKLFLVQYYHVT